MEHDLEDFYFMRQDFTKKIPAVTIFTRKVMQFNSQFVREARFEIRRFIKLAYSEKKNAIVLFFTDERKEEGTLKFNVQYNAYVNIGSFLRNFNLDVEKIAGKFLIYREYFKDFGESWIIHLNEPSFKDLEQNF